MRAIIRGIAAAAATAVSVPGTSIASPALRVAGETYDLSRRYETASTTSDSSSSGSSSGRNGLVERVVAVRDGAVELEYDLPDDAKPEARSREWTFPARVLRKSDGSLQLVNASDLAQRRDKWLAAAKWTADVCGRWIFTWNAFRIECDPQSVIETIRSFDLTDIVVREGATVSDTLAEGTAALKKVATTGQAARYAAELVVDPDHVRRARAKSDVAVGEILREPVTLEAALRKRASDGVSGTISIAYETDEAGRIWRRTTTTTLRTMKAENVVETETETVVVERKRRRA